MTIDEIWGEAEKRGLPLKYNCSGKTPANSLGAQLYEDVKSPKSIFIKVGQRPARFSLINEKDYQQNIIKERKEENMAEAANRKFAQFTERDLHPFLASFAFNNRSFNRGKKIYTKTIYHEVSKKGLNQWLHPDMVGFYSPIDEWDDKLLEFNKAIGETPIRLYSFELKKNIDNSNYRECFFQAVSNSSWANEGYLVTASVDENDNQLQEELERLSLSFGIGVILLNINDMQSSKVLFQERQKDYLDWETMNKLSKANKHFAAFLKNVRIDHESKQIHESEYDSTKL